MGSVKVTRNVTPMAAACGYLYPWVFEPEYQGKSKIFDGRTGEPVPVRDSAVSWICVG